MPRSCMKDPKVSIARNAHGSDFQVRDDVTGKLELGSRKMREGHQRHRTCYSPRDGISNSTACFHEHERGAYKQRVNVLCHPSACNLSRDC